MDFQIGRNPNKIAFAYAVIVFLLPVFTLVLLLPSIFPQLIKVFSDRSFLLSLLNSFEIASWVTVLSIMISFPAAFILAKTDVSGKNGYFCCSPSLFFSYPIGSPWLGLPFFLLFS